MNETATFDTPTFDTHRYIKHLTGTGFTEQQAEALAEGQVMSLNTNLATKADIAKVEATIAKVEGTIAKVEATLKADIAKVEGTIAQVEATLKTDIAQVEATLKVDIAKVEASIAQTKYDMIKWLIGIVLGVAAAQTTLVVRFLS